MMDRTIIGSFMKNYLKPSSWLNYIGVDKDEKRRSKKHGSRN